MSKPLLDGRSESQKIEEAIKMLKGKGYAIRGPFIRKVTVKTPAQLVRYFYDTLTRYRADTVTIAGGSPARDRVVAKDLIDARIKSGCSRPRAVAESCEIVELLFKYESRLCLAQTIVSMTVLSQGKMGWVTERLLQIREDLDRVLVKEQDAEFFQKLYTAQENNVFQENIDNARKDMEKVLKSYGDKNKKG